MMREIILFIAYKACSGKSLVWENNPFQYNNAVRLITVVFIFHIIQIVFLIAKANIFPLKTIDGLQYLFIIGGSMALFYLFGIIFSKKVLAAAVRRYKETGINKYAKRIAYSYLIINIVILLIIVGMRSM
jgi:hypothetical protein